MIFLGYKKCSTSNRAQAWLNARKTEYTFRPIAEENPTLEELRAWHRLSGLPLKRFFNTSGQRYRQLALKDRLPQMDEDEQLALLASDGLLVKRPLLIAEAFVLVGFNEAEWAQRLHADGDFPKLPEEE